VSTIKVRKSQAIRGLALLTILLLTILLLFTFSSHILPSKHPRKIYVMLTFDTEDFITPETNDVLKSLVEVLNRHGLRGEFYIVSEKMRVLVNDCPEVLSLLKMGGHAIGYHQNAHSVHPTIAEYSNVKDWETAIERAYLYETKRVNIYTGELRANESGGIAYMREVLGTTPISFRPPGYVWSPAVVYALRSLGVRVFSLSPAFRTITGEDLNWYMGVLQIPAGDLYMDEYLVKGDLQGLKEAFSKLCEGGGERRLVILALHPCMLVTAKFWDFNYYHGRNPGSPELVSIPPLRSRNVVQTALRTFEEFLEYLISLRNVNVITSEDLLKLVGEATELRITEGELIELASQVLSSSTLPSYPRISGGRCLTLAETYLVLAKAALSYLKSGELPSSVKLSVEEQLVLGPVEYFSNERKLINLTADLLEHVFSEALRVSREKGYIPAVITAGGYELSAADVLYLSAYTVWSAGQGRLPRFIAFTGREVLPSSAHDFEISFSWPCLPQDEDFSIVLQRARLQLWTLKPALFSP